MAAQPKSVLRGSVYTDIFGDVIWGFPGFPNMKVTRNRLFLMEIPKFLLKNDFEVAIFQGHSHIYARLKWGTPKSVAQSLSYCSGRFD